MNYGTWHGIESDMPGMARRFIVRRIYQSGALTVFDRLRDKKQRIVRYSTLEAAEAKALSLNQGTTASAAR